MTKLFQLPEESWPRALGWLVPGENCTELAYRICNRALCDLGILEVPNGSNLGVRVERMIRRAGLNPPQPWCACEVGSVFGDCQVPVPEGYALTDTWLPFVREGRWDATPHVGDAILYGKREKGPVVTWGNAHHIGIVVRVPELKLGQKLLLTIEGNRGFAGSNTNEGVGVGLGPVTRNDILGYVSPDELVKRFAEQRA